MKRGSTLQRHVLAGGVSQMALILGSNSQVVFQSSPDSLRCSANKVSARQSGYLTPIGQLPAARRLAPRVETTDYTDALSSVLVQNLNHFLLTSRLIEAYWPKCDVLSKVQPLHVGFRFAGYHGDGLLI